MARYRKIDPRFWKDEKVLALSQAEKVIALYAITAQSNRIGLFNFSPAMAAEDLEMSAETFGKGFGKVRENLGWHFDERYRILYLPTWWKYNKPENPNVLKACLGDLHEIPQTPLVIDFANNLRYLPEIFHATFRERLPEPFPKPSPNQEQEQEQKQEQGARTVSCRRGRRRRFVPPTVEEVRGYVSANPELNNVDPANFVSYFESGDPPWTDSQGKPVKSWKQKLRTWSSHNAACRTQNRSSRTRTTRANTEFDFEHDPQGVVIGDDD